ncbi:hypothetical protein [Archangium violaceum]|uniref:hypothetical protein n=1 Tax=Archangium violaceum TaxID=83451 RepID=UPI0036DB6A54
MTSTLLVVLMLSQADGPTPPPVGAVEPPRPASLPARWSYLTRLEVTTLALLPRAGVGTQEGFVQVEPTLILDGGTQLGLNLGAPMRLRLWGGGEGAGLVRRDLLSGQPRQRGRYTVALSAVYDWDLAGGRAPAVSLAHLDGTAVVVVRPGFEAHLLAGWGGRPGVGGAWGAAEVRWRFFGGHLYVLGQGGTLLFARGQDMPSPGAFASVGLGVDHAR